MLQCDQFGKLICICYHFLWLQRNGKGFLAPVSTAETIHILSRDSHWLCFKTRIHEQNVFENNENARQFRRRKNGRSRQQPVDVQRR